MLKTIIVTTTNADNSTATMSISGGRLALWMNTSGSVTIRQDAGTKSQTFRYPASLKPRVISVVHH